MQALTSTNYEKALKIIYRLDESDKEKLAELINEITAETWIFNFQNKMRNTPISLDEINNIVEEVRSEIYENSH